MILEIDTSAAQLVTDPTLQTQFEILAQLDGAEYLLRFVWMPREGCYYLSLLDQDENPIAMSIRLNVNAPLLRRFKDPRVPPGLLILVDLSNHGTEIVSPIDLGARVTLNYSTADELPLVASELAAA